MVLVLDVYRANDGFFSGPGSHRRPAPDGCRGGVPMVRVRSFECHPDVLRESAGESFMGDRVLSYPSHNSRDPGRFGEHPPSVASPAAVGDAVARRSSSVGGSSVPNGPHGCAPMAGAGAGGGDSDDDSVDSPGDPHKSPCATVSGGSDLRATGSALGTPAIPSNHAGQFELEFRQSLRTRG